MDFNLPYDREEYIRFCRNQFLPEDFEESSESISLSFSPQYTQQVTKIGWSTSLDLNVYELQHKSENDPRVSLSKESFRLLAEYGQKRALVLFVSKTSDNYRLSLVTIDLRWEEGKRPTREYSNPRRYSFFLGPDAKVHTPQEYLTKPGRVKDIDDLTKRFSIEVVNKDFYTEIAILFTKLTGGKRKIGSKSLEVEKGTLVFPSPDDTKRKEFAVRLIGRLVFCWFLKKKLSKQVVPLLSEELLSTDAVDKNKGYYHKILKPLFFEVLNTPMDERVKTFTSKPWSIIPFLNGGLFTPHDDDCYGNNEQEKAQFLNTLKVSDDWLRAILEVFETYNFTIDENTPVDVELSIEPEMLGRIFENLLAEINPETGETARKKATGSYYTPRPIVEYMVDESVKQYLLTKTKLPEQKISALLSYAQETPALTDAQKDEVLDALDTIKVIDPACGSGAFPMGILQKILLMLQKIDPDSQKWLSRILAKIENAAVRKELESKLKNAGLNYIHKLGVIQSSIYGVDIQPIAVDISKLRCFLSLIVDESIDDAKKNRGIEPLPNLEFKFVCANTLIGLPEKEITASSKKDTKGQSLMFEASDQIKELKELREKYLRSYGKEKQRIEERFRKTQGKMFEHALNWGGKETQTLKLSQWNPFLDEPCHWFDHEWMFGIGDGFDVVIANPPYIFSRENLTKEDKDNYKKKYSLTQFKINLYILFIEKSFNLMNRTGFLAFITPNNWLTLSTTSDLRRFILTKTKDINIVLNYEKVFENASVDTCILTFKKVGKSVVKTYEWTESNIELVNSQSPKFYLKNTNFTISNVHSGSDVNSALCEKICSISELLSNFAEVRNGVQAYTVGEGTPIQTENMKERRVYHSNVQKDQTWIKYFDGVDVGRYVIGWSGQFIKYGKNLSRPRKPELFKDERLLVRQIPSSPPYCINSCHVTEHAINDNNSMIIKVYDDQLSLKYILASINSKLVSFWFIYTFGKLQRKIFPQFKVKELRIFPIRKISREMQEPYISLVDKILNIIKNNDYLGSPAKQAKVKELEKQIDQMVYKLYDLTKEEIAIVENANG